MSTQQTLLSPRSTGQQWCVGLTAAAEWRPRPSLPSTTWPCPCTWWCWPSARATRNKTHKVFCLVYLNRTLALSAWDAVLGQRKRRGRVSLCRYTNTLPDKPCLELLESLALLPDFPAQAHITVAHSGAAAAEIRRPSLALATHVEFVGAQGQGRKLALVCRAECYFHEVHAAGNGASLRVSVACIQGHSDCLTDSPFHT